MTDKKKLENLFSELRETYVLKGTHDSFGKARIYIDSSSCYMFDENNRITDNEEPVVMVRDPEQAYFHLGLGVFTITHSGSSMSLEIQVKGTDSTTFKDLDINAFIKEVKKEFKQHGTLINRTKVRKPRAKKVKKVTKVVKVKKAPSKFIVVKGVKYARVK